MLMGALMLFGAICFFHLGVSQLPEATQPVLTISVAWTSAAPEVMETQIVNPIEQAVISVQGVQDIESDMRQGTASIKLTFRTGKDIDAALQETNSKLRSVEAADATCRRRRSTRSTPTTTRSCGSPSPRRSARSRRC